VHRLKYRREAVVAAVLGEELGDAVAAGLALGWRADAIVPVPLGSHRARDRGFDQAALLARAAARRSGVPCRRALRRVRETPTQVGLGRAERLANVHDAFAANPTAGSVMLVDDVATTGATLSACARALRRAGAREVRAIVVAIEA
jgi:competence protein ComFC